MDSQSTPPPEKTEKEIQEEIQAVFRQITASVTFLPVLDGNCTFNVLVYADVDSEVPMEWGDSDAKEIKNGEKVQLRSFSTSNHRVDTMVSYRSGPTVPPFLPSIQDVRYDFPLSFVDHAPRFAPTDKDTPTDSLTNP